MLHPPWEAGGQAGDLPREREPLPQGHSLAPRSKPEPGPQEAKGIFFFFFSCNHGTWKFPGHGLNLRHSYGLCHSCSHAGSWTPAPQENSQTSKHFLKASFESRSLTLIPMLLALLSRGQSSGHVLRQTQGRHYPNSPRSRNGTDALFTDGA